MVLFFKKKPQELYPCYDRRKQEYKLPLHNLTRQAWQTNATWATAVEASGEKVPQRSLRITPTSRTGSPKDKHLDNPTADSSRRKDKRRD
jgi:hypothetical protein